MANANKPAGLSPIGYLGGADWDGRGNVYYIASSDTDAYYPGDLVKLAAAGDANGVPGIAKSAAGDASVGVVIAVGVNEAGPWMDPDNPNNTHAPATKTKAYYALIADDPNTIFEIQEKLNAGSQFAAADVGLNANIEVAAPATGARRSGTQVNQTGKATTLSLNLRLIGLVRRPDNAYGAYAKWKVLLMNHQYRAGATGV
jgi:hypothetical protein